MGSRRLITVLLVCLFVYNDIQNTQANVGNHQEERREYQYQRSSKVVGGSGYYNSRTRNVEETAGNVDGWTQSQRDQVEGMAEKLRSELSTDQPYYGQGCSKICALIPGFVGRSQEEIDQIAKDMTSQIIEDLQSGKLVRSQMNQPNWFEHQVAQKILELRNHHQEQYQQNVYRAASRFHENQGSQVQPNIYAGGRTYSKDTEDVQQQQENVFSDDDLRQVQQSVFDQRQHQQQGTFYQQQSQNQQHTVYTRPVHRYYNSQTTSRDSTNEERMQTVYPTPIVVTNNVKEEKNYTSSSSTASVPQINVYNQYGRTDKEMEDRQYTNTQSYPTVIPSYNRSYYAQKEYEERHRNAYRPVTYPTSQTIQTSQTISEREQTMPVVIPTQRTTTRTNVHVEQEEKEVRRQPQLPQVYNYGREENAEERETTFNRNRPNIVPPTRHTIYEVRDTEQERKVVEVHTPSPVPVTSNKHSIYSHVHESEVVPNYQPRVVIDKNTEFEVLDHRRDYRPQVPVTQTQTTVHESEQEEHHRHQVPVTPATPQTTYWEDRNEEEVSQVIQHATPRYQPSTSQHVITEETDERQTHFRPRPYPVYTIHNQTIERNETSTSSRRRPTYPIYPSFKSNTTTFENGDSYIRSESHIPTTYIIEMTVEEYEERLHRLRNELNRLGYSRLTDEEYNATIAAGGFTHNGYKYIYNGGSGRFEKTSRIEVNEEVYEVIFETLQQKLREIGFGEMCQQEVKQTIDTGVFIRDGSKFVYDSGREQYEQIRITKEERREIFGRIQELLRRLGYRLLTQKENEGVLINGYFIRAAHQWIYNIVDGTVLKTIYVGDFAEFTDDEYREIYQKIQDTLKRVGYAQMSDSQCNATITSGTFERGGIYWSYNPNNGEFERILLSQEEYRDRVQILRDELKRLHHRELSAEEFRKIIYQGYFYHGGYRYEYVREQRRYERVELTAEEYRERLRQLQEQLIQIRYGTMNEMECNSTITNGKFYYGGYEWVYNFDTRDYQIGNKSDFDPTVPSNVGKDTSKDDKTHYDTTKPEEPPVSPANGNSNGRRGPVISKNRGDQPPQHFEEDYESDEIVEQEPGMGYYPIGKKPEVGLATPETLEQIRETTPVPTTSQPNPTYAAPSDYQRDRHRHEQQLTTQVWPTQPATISERRYHRKQTTYTQTSGVQPQQFATQRSMRHVPGNEFGEETEQEESSTPFEPLVVSTQAYLVGNERPYSPDDQNEIIERYLKNENQRPPAVYGSANNNYQQQEDSFQKSENIEDLGQQFEDFNGQDEDDVQQQVIDLDAEAEDLRQQQVDVNKDYDRNGQQRLLDNYAQESQRNEYNSHYHGQKETADEYEAEVVQVTEKAEKEKEESPGLWRRFKDKTVDIFG